mmetsp:Transcript_8497/g.13735  ORF Transcript_8497/g.13735 Transcript_8497/m.13735 type:complete len:89 (-) Transcript_8497:684-950(-)
MMHDDDASSSVGFVSLLLAIWWSFCIGFTSPTYVAVAGVAVVPLTTLLDYLTDNVRMMLVLAQEQEDFHFYFLISLLHSSKTTTIKEY